VVKARSAGSWPLRLLLAILLTAGASSALAGPATAAGRLPLSPFMGALGAGLHYTYGSSGLTVTGGRNHLADWVLAPTGLGRQRVEPLRGASPPGPGARAYDHGELRESYSRSVRGLEQGFTVSRRPAGTGPDVAIAMASSGSWLPVLTGPASVSILGPTGGAELTYSGLKVTDATGTRLPAHLEVSGRTLRISFSDLGARYPVVVDPWIQLAGLIPPSNAGAFGTSIAVSSDGSTVLVGDPSGGVAGTGQATVYTSSGGTWSAGTALTPPAVPAAFGTSVALSANGATALVGDPIGDTATVYTLSGGTWSAGTALAAPATSFSFGASVALSAAGTLALVGDPQAPAGLPTGPGAASLFGLSGGVWGGALALAVPAGAVAFGASVALSSTGATALVGDSTGGPSSRGVAYSFNGTFWGTRLQLTEPANAKNFGTSVALSTDGTTALVGDPTGSVAKHGAASVETLSGSTWSAPTALAPPSGAGTFGTSVALGGGGSAIVGDPTGGGGTGAASTYSGSGTTWSTGAPLAAPIGAATFGTSVALSTDGITALVGDPTGADLDPTAIGTVTAYTSNGRAWDLGVPATAPANSSSFGSAVALSSDATTVLVGDPGGGGTGTGQASAFAYNGSTLGAGTVLTPPTGVSSFGTAAAVSANGRTAVVGDPGSFDPVSGTGGTATVYTRSGTLWSVAAALTPPNTATDTAVEFGNSVAISADGTVVIVGDPQGGDNFPPTGAATVFTFSGGSWSAGTELTPPVTTAAFGTTVALSADGTTALVGDPTAPGGGSVTPYTFSNGSWSTGSALPVPIHASAFGTSLALSGTGGVALVGDPMGGASGTGAVTVFTGIAGSWSDNSSLSPSGPAAQFGTSLALSAAGTTALVGDPTAATYGVTAVYSYGAGTWSAGTMLARNAYSGSFGSSVALSGDATTAAVGDINGGDSFQGAVTVFSLDSTGLPTRVAATANPTSSTFGAPVTYSATVSPGSGSGTPTGTVTFSMGLTTLCTTPALVSGTAHCSASNTPLGGNGVAFASYSGDSTYTPSTGSTPERVTDTSSTGVTVSPTSTSTGSPVTYSATVTSGAGTPTGSVSFTVGGVTMCTATLSSGSGQCNSSSAPAGTDTVTGSYSGDLSFGTSVASTGLFVAKFASSTAVAVTPTSTSTGSPVTYSATVTSGAGTPTGSVSFTVGGATICTATLSSGSGQCNSSSAPAGTDTVTGSYSGDSTFAPSASTASLAVGSPPPPPPPGPASGYDLVGSDGGVFVFGTPGQGFFGSLPGLGVKVNNIVGIVPTITDLGYFLVGSDGGVFAFGNAPFENSLPGLGVHVTNIVGIVPTADDLGYFVVGSDGGVFAFGNAPFENSLPGLGVHVTNIVGIVPTADDLGYWLVSSNGSVYALGDAPFVGSLGGKSPTPIVGIAATHDSGGYWLVGQNGSVFPFGDAQSFGSLPALGVSVSNIAAIVPTPDGGGYWLIGSDGGIFAFGNATEIGSLPALGVVVNNIVGAVPTA